MELITKKILTFKLGDVRCALNLHNVDTVIRAIAVTTIPKAAQAIYGVIDFHGEHIPVVNIRERFSMSAKDISASDRFIISVWNNRKMAIAVDEVEHPVDISGKEINKVDVSAAYPESKKSINTGLEIIDAVSDEGGIIFIYDLEKLLGSETILAVKELFSIIEKEGLDD